MATRSARLRAIRLRAFFGRALPGLIATGIPQLKLIAGDRDRLVLARRGVVALLRQPPLRIAARRRLDRHRGGDGAAHRSQRACRRRRAQSRRRSRAPMRSRSAWRLPAAIGFALLAEPIARGLFERGAFGAAAIPQRSPRRWRRSAPGCPDTCSRRYSARCRSRTRTRTRRCSPRLPVSPRPSSAALLLFPRLRPRRRRGGDRRFRLGRRRAARHAALSPRLAASRSPTPGGGCRASCLATRRHGRCRSAMPTHADRRCSRRCGIAGTTRHACRRW